MALFKFQNYSAIKNAQNNPRAIATEEIKNGYVFKIEDNYEDADLGTLKEAAVPFATAEEAKAGDVWVAMNIVDKPEVINYNDFKLNKGEYVRSFNLTKLKGEILEVSSDICTTEFATVNVGDVLIPCNATDDVAAPMAWKVATELDTGYATAFEVVAKTTFGGFTIDGAASAGGYEVKIKELA